MLIRTRLLQYTCIASIYEIKMQASSDFVDFKLYQPIARPLNNTWTRTNIGAPKEVKR